MHTRKPTRYIGEAFVTLATGRKKENVLGVLRLYKGLVIRSIKNVNSVVLGHNSNHN